MIAAEEGVLMPGFDPHSHYDPAQPVLRHVELDLEVDFDHRQIFGVARLELAPGKRGPIDLDTRDLEIRAVVDPSGGTVPHALFENEPVLGRRLRVEPSADRVAVRFQTSPESGALQWLSPEQTEARRHPFLFSQAQPIHARAMFPVQDSPRVRLTYRAAITVPEPLTAVMSAGGLGVSPGPRPGTRTFRFEMPQPIPAYLVALAVGDLESREVGPRSRVFAEPGTVDRAAWEFGEVERMIAVAEALFGPYEWDRYDMLVLPPSFPYGGMENPRLTFLTPTILAGDRSLVDVVAHELAHSWTGNLVTNATMEHFWLNEGFTVWAERRIQEALHGEAKVAIDWAIGEKALEAALDRFGADSPLTCLRTHLAGVDPDEVFSPIPYEKGARFVVALERAVGRERFDRFVREYIGRFRFTSITTEEFLEFLEDRLPGAAAAANARCWLHEPGLPKSAPAFRSESLDRIGALATSWDAGGRPSREDAAGWTPAEMLAYLQRLPRRIAHEGCAWLDEELGLTGRGNHEILVEWLAIAAGSDYEPAFARLREVLLRVGRMKYLRPLYSALAASPRTRKLAREAYAEARPGYHALSRRVAEAALAAYSPD
jgi:leukotriene-A4 hydrolase